MPALLPTNQAEGPRQDLNTQGGSYFPSWGKTEPHTNTMLPLHSDFPLHHTLPLLFLSHFISKASGNPRRSTFKIHPEYDHFSPPSLPTPWSEPLSSPLDYHQDITWIPLPDSTSALYSLFSALQPDWYL